MMGKQSTCRLYKDKSEASMNDIKKKLTRNTCIFRGLDIYISISSFPKAVSDIKHSETWSINIKFKSTIHSRGGR